MQDQAQPQGAVEPIRALFQRPARAVGAQTVAVDPRAFPGVVVDGVVLVEVSGDALAGRHGPIAEPARRLDAAQRKRQEGRRDLRLARARVVGRRRGRGGRRGSGRCGGRRHARLGNQRANSKQPACQERRERPADRSDARGLCRSAYSTDHRLSPSKGGKTRWDVRKAGTEHLDYKLGPSAPQATGKFFRKAPRQTGQSGTPDQMSGAECQGYCVVHHVLAGGPVARLRFRKRCRPAETIGKPYYAAVRHGVPDLPCLGARSGKALFHRHALGQVPRLVDVAAARHGDVIGQQLQRDHRHQRLQKLRPPPARRSRRRPGRPTSVSPSQTMAMTGPPRALISSRLLITLS